MLAAACWGVGTVVSKRAVTEIPALTLLPIQLAVSVGVLSVAARRRGERPPAGGDGRRLGLLGLLNPGLAYALSLLGLMQVSASLSVLLWAGEPILILVLARLILRERVGAAIAGLSAVALGGLVLVVYDPAASGALAGIVLTAAGVACCAVYTVLSRRWLPSVESTLGVVLAQQAWALAFAIMLLVGVAAAGVGVVPSGLTPTGAIAAVASGLIYYGLAYVFYLSGLRRAPASVAAASFYLIPVFGVGAATLIGERLGGLQWFGALIVIAAVAAILVRQAGRSTRIEAAAPGA